jgi:hypothetical protein
MTGGIVMLLESTIIERVETFVRHPVFAGSDKAMDLVLEDLEAMVGAGRIPQATYRRLRQMILGSPHFAGDNGSARPTPSDPHPREASPPAVLVPPARGAVAFGRRIRDHGKGAGYRGDVAGHAFAGPTDRGGR